jgi:cysteine desulfurase
MDYSATTPVDPRVADKMIPYLREQFGNPLRAATCTAGLPKRPWKRREEVAKLVNADPREIIWTSGATESNNLAIKGAAQFYKSKGKHIITVKTEHKAVLDTFRELERGLRSHLPGAAGQRPDDLEQIAAAVRPDTILVSVMLVNNEIGVIQPMPRSASSAAKGHHLPRDAAQATGKVKIDLENWKVDLMSFSAHKTYGPRASAPCTCAASRACASKRRCTAAATSAACARAPWPRTRSSAWAKPSAWPVKKWTANCRIRALRDRLAKGLQEIEETYINGDMEHRVPHNLNVSFNYVEGESLIMAIKDIAVSSGSACTSASLEPSYVLRALGRSDELAHSSIRFTIGRFTTEEDIDFTIELIKSKVGKLRELSPLWDMYKDGVDLSTIQWAAH